MRITASLCAVLVLAACGGTEKMMMPVTKDVRVTIPATDPAYIDITGPEFTWMPGDDNMVCANTTYNGPDTAFTVMEGDQGKYGHHIVLLEPIASSADHADGEVYDCTQMKDFRPFAFRVDDGSNLKPGTGTFVKGGTRLVVQSHYINSGTVPILARDLVRLKLTPVAGVTTWASIFTYTQTHFSVPPHASGSVTFECALDQDMDLLVLGGHMHEWGSSYKVEIGATDNSMQQEYQVDPWRPEYRDAPPTNLYFENPKHLPMGTLVRSTCSWMNTKDTELSFPTEMCSTFGYVSGPKEPVVCNVGITNP